MAAVVAVLNALLPPAARGVAAAVHARARLPARPGAQRLRAEARLGSAGNTFAVDNFGWALLAALLVAAVSVVLEVIFGTNDDDTYTLRVVQRIARRQGGGARTDVPGIIYLEIDGLALPVLRRAMRDGNAPNMARWIAEGTHGLTEWETDLSSQTGASQAGILLGSNDDIPAFRWVDKESGMLTACSAPADCARIERERATGIGLLVDGGSSRGNLLSGEAEEVILTVSRMEAEKRANPGYRAFFANGFNVTRALVLFAWEVMLEWTAALRAIRRDVQPRGHRGGVYPFMRGAMCVIVRDLIVYGVLTDMMRGAAGRLRDVLELRRGRAPLGARAGGHPRGAAQARPAVRAHRPRAATRRAPTRSSCSPTTGRRRGRRSSSGTATGSTSSSSARSNRGPSRRSPAATSSIRWSGLAVGEATGRPDEQKGKRSKNDVSDRRSWCWARATSG